MRAFPAGQTRTALLQLGLTAIIVPLLGGCLLGQPEKPLRPTAKTVVAQDIYVSGIHYDRAQVGACGAQSAGTNAEFRVELFFSDQRNITISIKPYTGPGSYASSRSGAYSPPPVGIRYYDPPVIGTDTESRSEWDGTGEVQIDPSERSGTVAANLRGPSIQGSWRCR